jgi:hypothetical protein
VSGTETEAASGWVEIAVPSVLERWDGASFRPVPSPAGASLHDLYGRSEREVWAAGGEGIYFWNGVGWALSLPLAPLRRIWGSGAGELWAAGPAGLHYWNGKVWTAVLDAQAGSRLRVVGGASSTEAWIGGTQGVLQRYTGRVWRPLEVQGDVLALCAPAPGCAWFALGSEADARSGRLARWDGERLRPPELEGTPVRRLWGSSPEDVWGVGLRGTVVQWDGRVWTHHRLGIRTDLRGVWGSGPADVWVAGDAGRLFHWDGQAWADRSRPDGADLEVVWGLDRERVWLATRAYRARRAAHLDA